MPCSRSGHSVVGGDLPGDIPGGRSGRRQRRSSARRVARARRIAGRWDRGRGPERSWCHSRRSRRVRGPRGGRVAGAAPRRSSRPAGTRRSSGGSGRTRGRPGGRRRRGSPAARGPPSPRRPPAWRPAPAPAPASASGRTPPAPASPRPATTAPRSVRAPAVPGWSRGGLHGDRLPYPLRSRGRPAGPGARLHRPADRAQFALQLRRGREVLVPLQQHARGDTREARSVRMSSTGRGTGWAWLSCQTPSRSNPPATWTYARASRGSSASALAGSSPRLTWLVCRLATSMSSRTPVRSASSYRNCPSVISSPGQENSAAMFSTASGTGSASWAMRTFSHSTSRASRVRGTGSRCPASMPGTRSADRPPARTRCAR